jgi:hypothetical protein
MHKKRRSHKVWDIYLIVGLVFATLSIWLLSHGYQSDYVVKSWSKFHVLSENDFRLEDLGVLFPYIPFYLIWASGSIPGLHSEYMPYVISIVAAAFMFAHWNYFLVKKGYRWKMRLLLLLIFIVHPFTLWGVTSGTNNALTLLIFYFVCFGVVRMVLMRDLHSIIILGVSLAALFFTDDRSLYIALIFIPFVPMIASKRMVNESLMSVYVVLLTPFAIAFGSWVFMNWLFHSDPFMFIHAPEAMFSGVWQQSDKYSWLHERGGEWIGPTITSLWWTLLSFPAMVWIIWSNRLHERVLRSLPLLLILPSIGAGIATVGFTLFHPIDMIYLQIAVLMAAMLVLPRMKGPSLNILLVLFAAGTFGGWWVLQNAHPPEVESWMTSLRGQEYEQNKSDENFGKWLAKQPYNTMIDDRAGYKAIYAEGDAKNLILPFEVEVKLSHSTFWENVDQFAVINPKHPRAVLDKVGARFPSMYWTGMQGYHIEYDDHQWRVYRKDNIQPRPKKL